MSIETQIENLTNAVNNLTSAFIKFISTSVNVTSEYPNSGITGEEEPSKETTQEKPKATRKRRTKAQIEAAKAAKAAEEKAAAEQKETNDDMDDEDFLNTNDEVKALTAEDVHEQLMKVVQHPALGPKVAKKLVADAGAKKVGSIAEDKRQGVIDAINAELKKANA